MSETKNVSEMSQEDLAKMVADTAQGAVDVLLTGQLCGGETKYLGRNLPR